MTNVTQFGPTIRILTADDCADLSLHPPVALEIDEDATGFLAKVLMPVGIDAFGTGASTREAVCDLVEVMRAEAESLRARRERLSTDMARELEILNRVLRAEAPRERASAGYVSARIAAGATGPTLRAAEARNSYLPAADAAPP